MKAKATIIAALDNSRSSRSAFKQALTLAVSRRSELVAVAVTPRYEGTMSRLSIDDPERALSAPFVDSLTDAADYAASLGLAVRTEHLIGVPSAEIVAFAEREEAGLIVIGGCRRTQMERVLLGRTTARIIADAPCDVLIIPEGSEVQFASILVGINGSAASLQAGRMALELADDYGSTVHALAVVEVPVDRSLRYGVMEEARLAGRRNLEAIQQYAEKHGQKITCEVRVSSTDRALIDHAEKTGSQLIVIGCSAHSGVGHLMSGSIVERVVSQATCPVLAVRRDIVEDGAQSRAS
ncbi:MAG: universal stress protein [Desulfofustis sp.]|jgi:nucleotide-binding universal stress UspA family protein|nr:universal stress protein [Desulfofustis sp.]